MEDSEWVWDYYSAYDTAANANPTGPETGTRRVYCGGSLPDDIAAWLESNNIK